jgi:hypothetical protein
MVNLLDAITLYKQIEIVYCNELFYLRIEFLSLGNDLIWNYNLCWIGYVEFVVIGVDDNFVGLVAFFY